MADWYMKDAEGTIDGPVAESVIIDGIVQRTISRKTMVNRVGTTEWVAVESYPAFRAAVARRAAGVPARQATLPAIDERPPPLPSAVPVPASLPFPGPVASLRAARPARRWREHLPVVATASAIVTVLGLGVAVVLEWRALDAAHAELQEVRARHDALLARVDAVREEIAAAKVATDVDFASRPHQCQAQNDRATCTFTNMTAAPVRTCWKARLSLKSAIGVQLESLAACTGRIEPFSTVTMSTPWLQGDADDVCKSKGPYGERLDWSVCQVDFLPAAPPKE